MGVGDENILDVLRIEADLLHPADDQFLGVVGIDRIDEDDPLSRRQSPRRVNLAADEVEIVKDLSGLSVPGVTRRRTGGVRDVARHIVAGVFTAALRQQAGPDQGAEELESGRSLGRLYRGLDLRLEVPFARCLLREHTVGGKTGNNSERYADTSYVRFHNTSREHFERGERNPAISVKRPSA